MIGTSGATSPGFARETGKGRKPVILQILPALNGGGVEQGVIDINAAIVAAGGDSLVVSAGGRRAGEIARGGGRHIALPVDSKNPLTLALNVRRLRHVIDEYGVDIVHACSRAPAWSARRAVRGTAARFVTSCHAAHSLSGPLKRFYNSAIAGGERVIAVSQFLGEYLYDNYHVPAERIRIVHRGVALEKFHPNAVSPERIVQIAQSWRVPDGAAVILLPARLSRIKGHMFLLDALRLLALQDVFCVFVGPDDGRGAYRRELEDYIEKTGLNGKVRIVGGCDDMPAAYMISTVVVAPSLVPEGFGRVAVESQAMGRPTIVTDHGGARETVRRDETGWLVPPGDVPALARALRGALSLDARQRAMLATRAMSHVLDHFSNEAMCAGTLDVYAELLGAGAAREDGRHAA